MYLKMTRIFSMIILATSMISSNIISRKFVFLSFEKEKRFLILIGKITKSTGVAKDTIERSGKSWFIIVEKP